MNVPLNAQCTAFLLSAALGAALGLLYELFAAVRARFRRLVAVVLCDLLFFLLGAAGFCVFSFMVYGGVLRGYLLLGSGLGFALWRLTVGSWMRRLFSLVLDVLLWPISQMVALTRKIVVATRSIFCKTVLTYRMKRKQKKPKKWGERAKKLLRNALKIAMIKIL